MAASLSRRKRARQQDVVEPTEPPPKEHPQDRRCLMWHPRSMWSMWSMWHPGGCRPVNGRGSDHEGDMCGLLGRGEGGIRDDEESFKQFVELMAQLPANMLDTASVISRDMELFRGHMLLVLGFSKSLPEGHGIILPPTPKVQAMKPVLATGELKERISNKKRKQIGGIKDKPAVPKREPTRLPERVSPCNTERNLRAQQVEASSTQPPAPLDTVLREAAWTAMQP